jgi:hypothetical protein
MLWIGLGVSTGVFGWAIIASFTDRRIMRGLDARITAIEKRLGDLVEPAEPDPESA